VAFDAHAELKLAYAPAYVNIPRMDRDENLSVRSSRRTIEVLASLQSAESYSQSNTPPAGMGILAQIFYARAKSRSNWRCFDHLDDISANPGQPLRMVQILVFENMHNLLDERMAQRVKLFEYPAL
jgi:hypothetical protein